MSNNAFRKSNDVVEAQRLMKTAAWAGAEPGEPTKAVWRRLAGNLGFDIGRTRSIWYGLARRIDAVEMDQLRKQARYADAMRRRAEQHAQEVRAALFDCRQYNLDLDGGSLERRRPMGNAD